MKFLILSYLNLLLLTLPALPANQALIGTTEICDNSIDDDGDGQIDLQDEDCICELAVPHSLIPNPSFEDQNCCPEHQFQLDCASHWKQASEATTDYIHHCGWLGFKSFELPLPFPDGEGVVGFRNGRWIQDQFHANWKEYLGTCLNQAIETDEAYRLEFYVGFSDSLSSPAFELSLFGHSNCDAIPFGLGNTDFGCPLNKAGSGWVELARIEVEGTHGWGQFHFDFTAQSEINSIAIGPSCTQKHSAEDTYYFLDNLTLDRQLDFDFQIQTHQHLCANDFALSVPQLPGATYQWYRNGIAIGGAKQTVLEVQKETGTYVVQLEYQGACLQTTEFDYQIPNYHSEQTAHICEGTSFYFVDEYLNRPGSFVKTVKNSNGCDSTIYLHLDVEDSEPKDIQVNILDNSKYSIGGYELSKEGVHEVVLQSKLGCDSIIHVHLDFHELYIPNAFSPNGDGVNDIFNIFGGKNSFKVLRMQIVDRWGGVMYEAQNRNVNQESEGWDGRINGRRAPAGVYICLLTILPEDGIEQHLSRSLSLLR